MRKILPILAALALTHSREAQALEQGQDRSSAASEIIVEGKKSQRQRVRSFVKTLTPVRADEQIGRFVEPACPGVVGFAPHEAKQIEDRFRTVAKAAGVPLATGRCRTNVMMIAATNKRIFIESMPRYAPALVYKLTPKRIASLARSAGPVSAWQVPALLDQNGLAVPDAALDSENPSARAPMVVSNDGSRLNKPTQQSFMVSVLVVERHALARMTTRQFADYAAMRTLAPIDPLSYRHRLAGNPDMQLPAASILSLFEKGQTPESSPPTVTWWDFAFLQALYDMSMTRAAYMQRGDIQSRMNRILAKVPSDEL